MNAAVLLFVGSALSAHDAACAQALELSYDGSLGAATVRLAELDAAGPDLLCAYMELLARVRQIEQQPGSAERDLEFHRRAETLRAQAEERLRVEPQDARARFVRGATFGAQSRLHLFRNQRRAAARTAVAMRAELLQVPEGDALWSEAQFGLGLYDYYADVLPRVLKLLRFIFGLPAGDRERGLVRMQTAARSASVHRTEAQVQLLDAYVYYEGRADDALLELVDLRRRFPGGPTWGLRLAEHQCLRLGLYSECAATARAVQAAAERGEPNYAPVVSGMARVLLAEAALFELQPAAALAVLQPALPLETAPDWAARAQLAQAEALEELEERAAALAHYRAAAVSDDPRVRSRAQDGLRAPQDAARLRGRALLAEGRRLRAQGRERDAARAYARALEAWPGSQEASLRVAETALAGGELARARTLLRPLLQDESPDPPWVRPQARLLMGALEDLAGQRAAAIQQYKEVLNAPLGSSALAERAAAGLRRPFELPSPGAAPH